MKKLVLLSSALLILFSARADEGMWLPSLLGKAKIKEMQKKGLKLSASDLYSINNASLKDAIVLFGRGCTGEVVSNDGLLLTNHHCGYGQIQSHSTAANDYLTNGFWAMNRAEELPNPGLTVSFLVRMDDVTDSVLKGVDNSMNEAQRGEMIAANTKQLLEKVRQGNSYQISVEPLFYGNQYFMYVFEVFEDVRLVGAPPSSIGKFGGDTDNWMWPRHTGDFSVFRIYADKDNKPAKYSPDNVPYKPKKALKISLEGVKEGDFTFVYGFPARTNEYLLSNEVRYIVERGNPAKIALRTMRLDVMNAEQAKNVETRIKYASKNANVANAWKKWQGESGGVKRLGTIAKKEKLEQQFAEWSADKPLYNNVVPQMQILYAELSDYAFARDFYTEAIRSIELFGFFEKVASKAKNPDELKALSEEFYKDYSAVIDRQIAVKMLASYLENVPEKFQPKDIVAQIKTKGGVEKFIDYVFSTSKLVSKDDFQKLLSLGNEELIDALRKDVAGQTFIPFASIYGKEVMPKYTSINKEITSLYRLYMKGLMEMQPMRDFYPDANSTLRIAYGKVDGYNPRDAVYYKPFSTLTGIMEKDNPDIYDYDVPQRLRDIYAKKDFGHWGVDGSVPVAFIATNHTTGGNSGSPILNAKGELLGLNFDRTWEGTMSDIEYSPELCRNISVDIRYVLFMIDKIGGAGYLIEEMSF